MHHLKAAILRKDDLETHEMREREYYQEITGTNPDTIPTNLKNLNHIPSPYEISLETPPRYLYDTPARMSKITMQQS